MKELILASHSPRRKELLSEAGFEYLALKSEFVEEYNETDDPFEVACAMAKGKAVDVRDFLISMREDMSQIVIIGADTIVYNEGKIYGKPKNKLHAREMLKSLTGKFHSVYTGYCILTDKKEFVHAVETKVKIAKMGPQAIIQYVKEFNPVDKAGGYGIQDSFYLIDRIVGSYSNVVGLPIEHVKPILERLLKEE